MEWLACGLLLATHFSLLVGGERMEEASEKPALDSPEADKQLPGDSTSRV